MADWNFLGVSFVISLMLGGFGALYLWDHVPTDFSDPRWRAYFENRMLLTLGLWGVMIFLRALWRRLTGS